MGHTVGLHGYLHRPHPTRNARAMLYDFERGIAAIADATGVEPRLHRPPYGIYSPASLRMARERGLQPLLWSQVGQGLAQGRDARADHRTRVATGCRRAT